MAEELDNQETQATPPIVDPIGELPLRPLSAVGSIPPPQQAVAMAPPPQTIQNANQPQGQAVAIPAAGGYPGNAVGPATPAVHSPGIRGRIGDIIHGSPAEQAGAKDWQTKMSELDAKIKNTRPDDPVFASLLQAKEILKGQQPHTPLANFAYNALDQLEGNFNPRGEQAVQMGQNERQQARERAVMMPSTLAKNAAETKEAEARANATGSEMSPEVYQGTQPNTFYRLTKTGAVPTTAEGVPIAQTTRQTGGGANTPINTQPHWVPGAKVGTEQKPEQIPVPQEQVASFPKDVAASYPNLQVGQVNSLAKQLGPNPTQADYAKVMEQADKDSKAVQAEADRKEADNLRKAHEGEVKNEKADAATQKEINTAHSSIEKRLDKADEQLEKLHTATSTVGGNSEMGDALGVVKTLVATAGGQGTGVRITMPEIQRIAQGRGWAGGVEAFFEHAAGYGTLTPTQRDQIKGIISDITTLVQQKRDLLADIDNKILGAGSIQEVRGYQKEMNDRMGGKRETPPHAADPGMKWQHNKDLTQWRQVPVNQ